MEFVKVEHIEELLSEDPPAHGSSYGREPRMNEVAPNEYVREAGPLAPDPLAADLATVKEMQSMWHSIKEEPAYVSSQETNNAEDEEEEEEDEETNHAHGRERVTRSQIKESNAEGKEGEGTQGGAAEAASADSTQTPLSGATASRDAIWCPLCERGFPTRKILEQHLNTHTGKKPFECDICGMRFSWENNARRHKQNVHRNSKRSEHIVATAKTMAATVSEGTATPPTLTSKPVETTHTHAVHRRASNENNCSNLSSQNHSQREVESAPFECPVCERKFSNRTYLDQHMNTHTGERPFECSFCDVKFTWESNLVRHVKRQHKMRGKAKRRTTASTATATTPSLSVSEEAVPPKTSSLKPTESSNTTSQPPSVKYEYDGQGSKQMILHHLRRHTMGGSHQCNVCGRIFSSRWYLDRHINTHTGERPFPCPLCPQKFFWECNLKRHMCVHMREISLHSTGQGTYVEAQISEKPVENSSSTKEPTVDQDVDIPKDNLVSKELMHKSSWECSSTKKCSMCPRKFTQPGSLRRHMLIHLDVKPFSCLICGKTFSRKDNLQSHCAMHAKKSRMKTNKKAKQNSSLKRITSQRKILPERKLEVRGTTGISQPPSAQKDQHELGNDINKSQQSKAVKSDCEEKREAENSILQPTEEKDQNEAKGCPIDQQQTTDKYPCILCPKRTNSKAAMLAHMQKHMGGNRLQCSICGKKLAAIWNLPRHMLQHTGEKLFHCSVCGKEFGRKEHLNNHSKVHDRVDTLPTVATQCASACVICGKPFENNSALQKHQSLCQRTNISSNEGKRLVSRTNKSGKIHFSNQPLHSFQRDRKSGQLQCHICKKTFCSKWYLNQHLSIHTGDRPLICKFCPKTFRFQSCFQNHLKMHRRMMQGPTEDRAIPEEEITKNVEKAEIVNARPSEQQEAEKHKCSICEKVMTTKAAFLCHILRHKGEKGTKCSICDKTLSSPQHLVRHMHIHTGEKQYQSSMYRQQFNWKKNLKKISKDHLERQKRQSEDILEKSASPSGEIIVETTERKEAVSIDNLQQVATGESKFTESEKTPITKAVVTENPNQCNKQYQCGVCGKTISTRMNLVRHMRQHTGEEPFQCSVCEAAFSRADYLKIHKKSHTKAMHSKTAKLKIQGTSKIVSKRGSTEKDQKEQKQKTSCDSELEEKTSPMVKDLLIQEPTQPTNMMTLENQSDKESLQKCQDKCVSNMCINDLDKTTDKSVTCVVSSDLSSNNLVLQVDHPQILLNNSTIEDQSSESISQLVVEAEESSAITNQPLEVHRKVQSEIFGKNISGDMNTKNSCGLCGRMFSHRQKLQRHLMNQSCLGPFECNLCQKQYSYKGSLDRHMQVHTDESLKQTDVSKEMISSLEEPEVIVIDSRSCSPVNILQHNLEASQGENAARDADNPQRLGTEGEYSHPIIVSDEKGTSDDTNLVVTIESPEEQREAVEKTIDAARSSVEIRCGEPAKDDTTRLHQEKGRRSSPEALALEEPEDMDAILISDSAGREIVDIDVVTETNQTFECDICGRTFDSQRSLLLHDHDVRTNRSVGSFQCKFCSLRFTGESQMLKHLQTHEENSCEQQYMVATKVTASKCSEPVTISERSATVRSVTNEGEGKVYEENRSSGPAINISPRTGQDLEQCHVCGDSYKHKDFIKHMRIHTGGISFQCGLCGHIFSNEAPLHKHAEKHGGKLEIQFLCHLCGQSLCSPDVLKDHVRKHADSTQFHCGACGINFNTPHELQEHDKTHRREKRFQCKFCRKKYALEINLIKHLKRHKKNNHGPSAEKAATKSAMTEGRVDAEGSSFRSTGNHRSKDCEPPTGSPTKEKEGGVKSTSCSPNDDKESLHSSADAHISVGETTRKRSEVERTQSSNPSKASEDHERPSTDALAVGESLVKKKMELEIEAIDISNLPEKHKRKDRWPRAEIVITLGPIPKRNLEEEKVVSSGALRSQDIHKTKKRRGPSAEEPSDSGATAKKKGEESETHRKDYGPRATVKTLEIEGKLSGGISRPMGNHNRNNHWPSSEVMIAREAMAKKRLAAERTMVDWAVRLPENHQKHNQGESPMNQHRVNVRPENNIAYKMQEKHRSKNGLPAETEITEGMSKKGLEIEVERTASGNVFRATKNRTKMCHGSTTEKEVRAAMKKKKNETKETPRDVASASENRQKKDHGPPAETQTLGVSLVDTLDLGRRVIDSSCSPPDNHVRINHRQPAEIVITAGAVTRRLLDVKVSEEMVSDDAFRVQENFPGKKRGPSNGEVSNTKMDVGVKRLVSVGTSGPIENYHKKNRLPLADNVITRELLSQTKTRAVGSGNSSRPSENDKERNGGPSVETRTVEALVTRKVEVEIVEVIDVELETEGMTSGSRTPVSPALEADRRQAKRGSLQPGGSGHDRAHRGQHWASGLSMSSPQTWSSPPSITAGTPPYDDISAGAHKNKRIDISAVSGTGQPVSGTLSHSYLQEPQVPLLMRPQLPGNTWKEPVGVGQPDRVDFRTGKTCVDSPVCALPSDPWYSALPPGYTSGSAGHVSWMPQTPPFQTSTPSNSFMTPPYLRNNIYNGYSSAYTDIRSTQRASSGVAQSTDMFQNIYDSSQQQDLYIQPAILFFQKHGAFTSIF